MSTTYFHMTLCFYSSHMYIKAVLHTDCHANTPPMVHMQNLHCLTNLDHHFFHPLTLSLFQLGKCEWERKLKREGCGRGKRSPARMEAAACWANVLFPLLHKYMPTFTHKTHALSTWSSQNQSKAPQCALFSWGRGKKRDVLVWKNSEFDRRDAGVMWGHGKTFFLLFLIRVSSV